MIDHYAQLMTAFTAFAGYTVHGTRGMIEHGRVLPLTEAAPSRMLGELAVLAAPARGSGIPAADAA